MIGNITSTGSSILEAEAFTDNINELTQVSSGKFILSATGLKLLQVEFGFKQVRMYCYKPSVNRTFHIMTNPDSLGEAVITFMTLGSDVRPKSCNSYTALPDDNSVMSNNCLLWRDASWSYPGLGAIKVRIYFIQVNVNGKRHNMNPIKFNECDDDSPEKEGKWLFYVR